METTAGPGHGLSQQCCSCDGSSASCWCLDCGEALCDGCLSAHRRVTLTRSHRILNQPPAADVSTPPTKFCRLHPSEPLKLYCFTCNQLTCRDCQLTAHMNHRYQFVTEALDSMKKQLEAWVQPIRARRGAVRRSLLDLETRLQDIADSQLNLRTELLQSYGVFAQWLNSRMEVLFREVEQVCELECEQVRRRMAALKRLQQSLQSATEIAENAKNTNDLSALQSYTAQIEAQLKDCPDQDSSPPQTMFQLKVLADRKSVEAVMNMGELNVSRVPFSVTQPSNQSRDAPAASSPSSPSSPLTPSCLGTSCPQTQTSDSGSPAAPVPASCSSTSSESSSSQLCLSSSSFTSSSATPPTSTCVVPRCKPLPQTGTANGTASPVPGHCPPTSWKSSSSQLSPPSSCPSVNQSSAPITTTTVSPALTVPHLSSSAGTRSHLGTTDPSQPLLLINCVQLVSSVNLQPVGLGFPVSAGGLKLIRPHQNQPVAALLADSQTAIKVSCTPFTSASVLPPSPMLCSQTEQVQPQVLKHCGGRPILTVDATGNQSQMAPPSLKQESTQQPLTEESCTESSSGPPSPDQRLSPDVQPPSSSQQPSPVVRAVADSACDCDVPPAATSRQELSEDRPTSTVSEDTGPSGTLSAPEVSHRDAEEPSSVIGPLDRCLSQWQPRVSLYRLPVPLSRPGRGFRLVPAEDKIYLEVMDTQSHVDDITATVRTVICSACGSASGSVVCSACGRGYHRGCHVPPVGPDLWPEWICSLCQDLSDPSDPYSSDRPPRPLSPRLSLQQQRRCESLLLHLKVEGCSRLPEFGRVWSQLRLMSERLSLRRPPAYQTAAELLSDTWSLFTDASQDDVLNRLQESFHSRLMETFSSELPPSVLKPPSSSSNAEAAGRQLTGRLKGSQVTAEEQEVVTRKVKETRKRLRELLQLKGMFGSKRTKEDKVDE